MPGFEDLADGAEDFLGGLAAAGYPREAIDFVLCTHLHFDHVGWNTLREGERRVPTFPNARYLFARAEWEHWSARPTARPTRPRFDATVRPIVDAGLADLVEPDHKLCDSVRLVPTAGHTPGHVSVEIASQGERAFITGDMTHHPVQWAEPGWKMPADVDSRPPRPRGAGSRARSATTAVLVIGTHYAPPCAGHLVRGERGVWFRRSENREQEDLRWRRSEEAKKKAPRRRAPPKKKGAAAKKARRPRRASTRSRARSSA